MRPLLTRRLAVGLVLLVISACAQRSDWIEGTLVTVDVAGRWAGKWSAGGGPGGEFEMTLRQTGPKATGDVRLTARNALFWSGPIDGTVSGDTFKFSQPDGKLRGARASASRRASTSASLPRDGAVSRVDYREGEQAVRRFVLSRFLLRAAAGSTRPTIARACLCGSA